MKRPNNAGRLAIVVQQVDAMQMAAAGRREEAVAALRKAAAAKAARIAERWRPIACSSGS